MQYVKYAGKDRSSDIMNEHEFKDNLCLTLPQLDTFIKTTISNRRPIPVSATREEMIADYPDWATRELLMNAICHRDYSSSGPIQFYQYNDRIEIQNHGGLFGRATVENFPFVNDYRNIVVAEAMKVLGYVNRHSRGVIKVQKDLAANGNGEAVYDFGYQTALLVKETKSPRGEELMNKAIENGLIIPNENNLQMTQNGDFSKNNLQMAPKDSSDKENILQMTQNRDSGDKNNLQMTKNNGSDNENNLQMTKNNDNISDDFPSTIAKDIYNLLKNNRKAKYSFISENLGVSDSTIRRAIEDLKKSGFISVRSKKNGEWQLLK